MMSARTSRYAIAAAIFFIVAFAGTPVQATQGHTGVEGVWVHQFAHLFFLFSMGILIYWLRKAGLVRQPGWRYIQYAAMFFILWNIDTIMVHFLDEQIRLVDVEHLSSWQIRINSAGNLPWLSAVYYMVKLDHLLCVPAMVCLWIGLRHMAQDAASSDTGKDRLR